MNPPSLPSLTLFSYWRSLGTACLASCALFSVPAPAATITVPIELADQDIHADNTGESTGLLQGRVGLGYVGKSSSDYVMPFKLPTLPVGERILSATLKANLEFWSDWGQALHNVDLYGIGVTQTSSAATAPQNFVNGTNPSTNSSAFLLQDNWITRADISGDAGSGKTIPKVSQDFAWFVQGLYDNGSLPGTYGFLTLAHDSSLTAQRYYGLSTANSTSFPKPVLILVTGTVGKSYYLNGDSGSDSAVGSALAPWKTINRAQSQIEPGDTLYCTGTLGVVKMVTTTGTAGELPYKLGTTDKPISYKAWPGKSQPRMTRLAFDGVQKDTYLAFDGFLFDRGVVNTPGSLENAAVSLPGAWHITFTNCDFVGAQPNIPVGAMDPTVSFAPYTPDSGPVVSGGNPGNASYVRIQNCRIKNGGLGIDLYENEAYTTKQNRYWELLNNDISNSAEDGIHVAGGDAGAGSVVRGNFIHDQNVYTAPLIYVGFAYDALGRNPAALDAYQWAPMIQDTTGKTGVLFYSTRLDSNGWTRFYILANDKNNPPAIFNNSRWKLASNPNIYFQPLLQDGVTPAIGDNTHPDCISVMGQMTGALFEKNHANVGKYAGQALKIQNIPLNGNSRPPTNLIFQNNLFYSTTYTPASGFLLNIAGGKNVRFLHNTIFGGPGVRFVDLFGTGFQGIYFYNNIIAGGAPSNTNGTNLATSDYNLWMTAPTGAIQRGPHDVVLLSGMTTAQQITAAGFLDANAGDLRIQSGSAAQNIGALSSASLPLPLDDLNGFPRGTSAPDLPDAGAFEIGSPAP